MGVLVKLYGSETANSCPKSKAAASAETVSVCALFHKRKR